MLALPSDVGGPTTTTLDHTRNLDGGRLPSSPSPSTRAGIWRCAMPRAPRQLPSLQPPNRAFQPPRANSPLDKTWGQRHSHSLPRPEGFGIPPLETMARGRPVISSNAASLVEVGGDAVAYVDHGDGWRDAIIGLAGNQNLCATMAAQGRKRAVLFSWKRSAQFYLDESCVCLGR
jgi:hypothetical protein